MQVAGQRFLVAGFLPLIPLLAMFRGRRLRSAIVLSGLAFVWHLFGGLYAAYYLLLCIFLHWLGQRFAVEVRRTDVLPWGPPLAAWLIIGGGYVVSLLLGGVRLPAPVTDWVWRNAPWLLPFGVRGVSWELDLLSNAPERTLAGAPPLLLAFLLPHFIGTAYLAVRMLQYFSELKRGTISPQRRTLLNFLAFTCYAPTLMQGPLERYARFQEQLDTCHERRSWPSVAAGVGRMAEGLAKKLIALWYVWPIVYQTYYADNLYYKRPEAIESYALLFFGVHLQVLYLYLDFSGYSDLAIGMSRLLGYRVAENFAWPWFSCSLTEMWRRWHITLSFILRDYIFVPLTRKRWPVKLNLCLTFLLCGLWHLPHGGMALWGIVMGLMVGVNQSWVRWMRAIDRSPGSSLHALRHAWLRLQPLPRLCAWALTINAFALSGLLFFGGTRGTIRLLTELLRRPLEHLLG